MSIWLKIVAVLAALLAFVASYAVTFQTGRNIGGDECRAAVEKQANDNLLRAEKEKAAINAELQNDEDKIISAPDSDDGPVAPVLGRALGWVY